MIMFKPDVCGGSYTWSWKPAFTLNNSALKVVLKKINIP